MSDLASSVAGLSLEKKRALAAELLRRRQERPVHGLSFGQRALWFLHRLEPENPAHGIPFVARVRSRLDLALLRRCLQDLSDRHAVLRTTYQEREGEPVQVVHPRAEPCLEVIAAPGRSWPEVVELLGRESRRPFDLERGSVMRVTVVSRGEEDHGLLLVIHHVAADLWSMVILLYELRTLYGAAQQGRAAELPPLRRQYTDFVRAEAEMLAGPAGERMWQFWRQRLAEPPVLALPADRSRRSARADRGEAYDLPVGADLVERLRTLGSERGATLFMTLLAAYEALLRRQTGQQDLVVGSLAAKGRSRAELAGVVGFLDNPVALRESVDGRLSFAALLERVRQTVLAAIEHQDYPFSLLVERLQPVRDLAHAAIFQTMFILQVPHLRQEADLLTLWLGTTGEAVDFGGLRLEPARLSRGAATALAGQLDLSLAVADLGGWLSASFQYDPDLFDRTTVARMALQFQTLLTAASAAPDRPLASLELMGTAERHQIVAEWNDTREPLTPLTPLTDICLHHLVAARAARNPRAPAVLGGDAPLSYGELVRRADLLARHLRRLGVGPGVRVGVCVEPSPEMVVGLLAILEAGGAYVPVDPRYPRERRSFLLQDAGARLVLTQERLRPELTEDVEALCIDTFESVESVEKDAADGSLSGLGAGHLAYVIYTSGSTGRPKGVMIDHRAAVNTVLDINARFGVGPDDRVFAISSLSFDLSVYDVFGTLAAGGAIVLPPHSATPNPAAWSETLERHGVTIWNSAPALLEMLLQYAARPLPPALRLVMLSGDWIAVGLPDQVRRHVAAEVVSLGGATEAAIWSICHPVERRQPERLSIPYGRPLANQRFHVLDRDLRLLPVGVVGDLYIGGTGVARGYQSRPDLTAERFLPDPFDPRPEARLYRTGDLGRYLQDGEIEFLGRADHQVKIRGFRVELGEVETQLARHPGVREALALVRDDLSGGRQLVAYYTAAGEAPAPDELRRHLRQALPDYMVPTFLVGLDAFPLTPNGKVDRRSLPIPAPGEGRDAARPRTPMEEILAAVWSEVLGLPGIGPGDNFFALGGHSLKATQVASRLRERLGIELPLRRIFEAPSLAELAASLAAASRAGEGLPVSPIEPFQRREMEELPLSFAQERMWLAEQLEPGTGAYNMAVALVIRGPLDPRVLETAVAGIVERHEALRTRFIITEAGPVQVIEPRVSLALPVVDLAELPEEGRTRELRDLAGEAARHPFELTAAPLLRVSLVRRGAADHLLLIAMHHIVSDGWSMGVFLQELARLYEDFAMARPASLPALPIQYVDFARWQRESLQGEALESLLDYWRRRLAGAPLVLELPADRPRPPVRSLRGASRSRLLAPDLQAALKALSQRHGATLFMTLLAAFKVLLCRYTGQHDILVGTDIANRNRRELEGLIGFFVNHPVLRTDLSGNPTFAELLDRVRRATLEAYAHQDLPFEKLVEELQPERDLSRPPLFQMLFVLQNVPLGNLRTSDLTLTPQAVDSGRCKFDLMLMMWEIEDGLLETWSYSTDLFAESTITRMSGHLEALLRQVISRPDARLNDFEIATEQERARQEMEREQRQNREASTLRLARRRAVDLSSVSPIATRVLQGGETSCLVVEPARQDVDLVSWAQAGRDFIEANLATYGAILFRGFPIGSVAEFESFAQAVCPVLFDEYGDLPRAGLGGKVYTSTPYPPDQWILYHNESSHMDRWPLKQLFHCVQPAESGGETPIADCRRVYQRLDPELRRAFAERGVMYVRNFTPGIDVSWQEFFHTGDRAEAEAACRAAGLDVEWKTDGTLRTRRVCPAVARHPKTGEEVFFNQIQAHHIACLDPEVRASLLALFPEDALPRNVYFGDGTRIESAMMDEIVGVYRQVAVGFPWLKGDVLVVDNMLTAHSRAPFTGARKIVVAMGEMVAHDQL